MRISLLLFISALGAFSCSTNRTVTDGEMHILPMGYTGAVRIIFNQPDGEELEMSKGMRVYRIPSNGVLRTRFKFVAGYFPCDLFHYYYVKDRDTTSVPELMTTNPDSVDKRKVYVSQRSATGDTLYYSVGLPGK